MNKEQILKKLDEAKEKNHPLLKSLAFSYFYSFVQKQGKIPSLIIFKAIMYPIYKSSPKKKKSPGTRSRQFHEFAVLYIGK